MSVSEQTFEKLELSQNHRDVFHLGMKVLDEAYGPPLLWSSAKLSSWYAVGLLARGSNNDIDLAHKLLSNALLCQDLDPDFEQNYGSFKSSLNGPYSSGENPLWVGDIYVAYDPNNALFVCLASVLIEALFPDRVSPDLRARYREAMHTAMKGNSRRHGLWHGDDLYPSYTNPFLLRCVCTTYIANLVGDADLAEQAEGWAKEAVELFDLHNTPGEYNSPTYAGVTFQALALAKYCPESSYIHQHAPRLLKSLWEELAEIYNPSLLNVAGPWDRAYGFCMTQYYATVGANIASVTGLGGQLPIPQPLIGSEHYSDAALIPMQMLTAPYTEAALTSELRDKFCKLYSDHWFEAQSIYPPRDASPRKYKIYVADGLSVGGVEYDTDRLGGPKGDVTQFNPGVVQWDSGKHGAGCGWISVWPDSACAAVVPTESSLTIAYRRSSHFSGSELPTKISLHIGYIPFHQLTTASFSSNRESLPGLDVELTGNVVESGRRSLTFDKSHSLHGARYYRLTYEFGPELYETEDGPTLYLGFKKTKPPVNDLVW